MHNYSPHRNVLCTLPTFLEFLGYAFCPGNCVMGPWVKYEDYLRVYESPSWDPFWFSKIFFSLLYSLLFLSISTCWNRWMIPDGVWSWWIAYRDAMSFRASHYFVSYVSEATATAAGIGGARKDADGGRWPLQVVRPHEIEIPRSLTEVVKAWNIPMHQWLKNCESRLPKML